MSPAPTVLLPGSHPWPLRSPSAGTLVCFHPEQGSGRCPRGPRELEPQAGPGELSWESWQAEGAGACPAAAPQQWGAERRGPRGPQSRGPNDGSAKVPPGRPQPPKLSGGPSPPPVTDHPPRGAVGSNVSKYSYAWSEEVNERGAEPGLGPDLPRKKQPISGRTVSKPARGSRKSLSCLGLSKGGWGFNGLTASYTIYP